jgi:tRNA dimethylallyltransferase
MKKYLAIIGPTASGKSALALKLAHELRGELINCDSIQIYKGFDIGAAKPSVEERASIPHHLIDILQGSEDYDARAFAAEAEEAIHAIRNRCRTPIVVGGTGLYLRALWRDGFHDLPKSAALREQLKALSPEELRTKLDVIDPGRAQEIHGNDRFRLQRALEVALLLGHSVKELAPSMSRRGEAFVIYLENERKILHERIARRSSEMLDQGLVDEVQGLLARGVPPTAKPMQSIGYREAVAYLNGDFSRGELQEKIMIATRQYARRQETLFRKMPKDFVWTEGSDFSELLSTVKAHLAFE